MKNLFLLFLTIFVFVNSSFADKKKSNVPTVIVLDGTTNEYNYIGIVKLDSITKGDAFNRAKKYILENFKTNDNNIQSDEKNYSITNTSSLLIEPSNVGATLWENWTLTQGFLNFKMTLEFKDDKYRFVISNIVIHTAYTNGIVETFSYGTEKVQANKKMLAYLNDKANEKLSAMISKLESSIRNTGNDW